MITKELNDQARQGIAHPAEWNKWYSYAKARRNDTLNAEEDAIWKSIWEVTSGLDKLVTKGIAARRKSIRTTIAALLLISGLAANAQADHVTPMNHRDSLLVQQGFAAGARNAVQRIADHMEEVYEEQGSGQREYDARGEDVKALGMAWAMWGLEMQLYWIHEEFGIYPVAPTKP